MAIPRRSSQSSFWRYMPAIYGWAERVPGAAREPRRCASSTLSWCFLAIAWSILIFRISIGSSDAQARHKSFGARENVAGGDRPHRLESSHGSGGVARAGLFYTGSRKARIRTAAFARSLVRDAGAIHLQSQRALWRACGVVAIGERKRRGH